MIDESALAKPDCDENLESTWPRSLRIFLTYTVGRAMNFSLLLEGILAKCPVLLSCFSTRVRSMELASVFEDLCSVVGVISCVGKSMCSAFNNFNG